MSGCVKLMLKSWSSPFYFLYSWDISFVDTPCILHCVMEDGHVYEMDLSKDQTADSLNVENEDTLDSLLAAIDNLQDELKTVRQDKHGLVERLAELSTAAYLLQESVQLIPAYKESQSDCYMKNRNSISCSLSSSVGAVPLLSVEVHHNLPHALSNRWSVIVSLFSTGVPSDDLNSGKAANGGAIVIQSINIDHEWKAGERLTVELPVTQRVMLCGGWVEIQLSLNIAELSKNTNQRTLCIPVCKKEVDILTFLRTKQRDVNIAVYTGQSVCRESTVEESLTILAKGPDMTMWKEPSISGNVHYLILWKEPSISGNVRSTFIVYVTEIHYRGR